MVTEREIERSGPNVLWLEARGNVRQIEKAAVELDGGEEKCDG